MSLVITRERECASPSFPVPLTRPSVDVAMEFLRWMVPPTVFSSGSGRRRRRGDKLLPDGRRSDQGFILFYTMAEGAEAPEIRPLKSPRSMEAYLRQLAAGDPQECWVSTQITQFRAGRDGRLIRHGFGADTARQLMGIVVDMDGGRMDPLYRQQLLEDWWAFQAGVDERAAMIGVEDYRLVRSGPVGVHLYIPLLRPDGLPLRASEDNLAKWGRVAAGICRLFADMGADANAVRAVQPFVIPGLPRAKHPGFIPYVAARREGARADLIALLRRLSELKLMPRREQPLQAEPLPTSPAGPGGDVAALLEEITTRAVGVASGDRNNTAYQVALYLTVKGATEAETWAALTAWNRRNDPPLTHRELQGRMRSALRCEDRSQTRWAEMRAAPWNRLRAVLGLPAARTGYVHNGRWRPLTPAKSWEDRKTAGGREHYEEVAERLLRFVAGEGGRVELTHAEVCNAIDTNRSTLRAVLERLQDAGRLMVTSRRGRGGKTVLAVPGHAPAPCDVLVTENDHSGNSSEAVENGAWVGPAVPVSEPVPTSASADPLQVVAAVVQQYWGLDLHAHEEVHLLAGFGSAGPVRLYARGWQGQELLWSLETSGVVVEIARRLGRPVLVDRGDPGPDG